MTPASRSGRPRVSALSYLNTVPLVWGLRHGQQRDLFDLLFALPSQCAADVVRGDAEIGLLPVIEIHRNGLDWLPETGIACRGAVRSILFVSKVEPARVGTLAADMGSRTSVMLSRIWLAERFGAEPRIHSAPPDLPRMLAEADAALVIGDAALRLDPAAAAREYFVADLGTQWAALTGLPMVFALWSGRRENLPPGYGRHFLASYRAGREHLEEIVEEESAQRGLPRDLAWEHLTRQIVFELNERDHKGRETFLAMAARLEARVAV